MGDEEINLKDIKKGVDDGKKEFIKIINTDRFKTWKNGYKFDKWIFQTAMFFIFGLMFYIAWSNNFQLNYFDCRTGDYITGPTKGCDNPFYEPADWTNEKYLPNGEYGFKPTPLFNNLGGISVGVFILAGILNHLIYNKGFKIKEV